MTFVPINLPSPAIRGPTQIGVCRSYYHRRTNVRTGTPARCPGPWVDIPGGRLRPLSRILFRAFVASGPHVGAGVTGEGVEAVLAAEPVPLAGVVAEELGAQQGDAHAADGVDGLLDRCRRHGGAPVALADQLREHRDRDLLLRRRAEVQAGGVGDAVQVGRVDVALAQRLEHGRGAPAAGDEADVAGAGPQRGRQDRKSTRLNSSHEWISYAVFCLKKKNKDN